MAATTGALTAVLTADCSRATSRLPFGRRAMALRSRRAGSVVMDAGRIKFAEAPELALTNTSEDFLRASPSLWIGTGAATGTLATVGVGCGTGLPAFA